MKTIIEIFDENQLNNAVAVLRFKPKKVIYVGYPNIMPEQKKKSLKKLFQMKNIDTEVEFCEIDRYNFEDIVATLETVVTSNEDCAVDVTGGKELAVAAVGYVVAKYGVPMFQFNVRTDRFVRVFGCDNIEEPATETLSVKESIMLNGGVVLESEAEDFQWDFNEGFLKDIRKMWEICRENCGRWNKQCNVFRSFAEWGKVQGTNVEVDIAAMERRGADTMLNEKIIQALCDGNLLQNYTQYDNFVSFTYKNNQIKQCLTKAGNILELYGYALAMEINKDEPGRFTDAEIGVHIDWDGDAYSGKSVKNEVDLVFMKGLVPIFVSCKNGEISKEALYELETVADEFGGEYVTKTMLTTYIAHDSDSKRSFIQRAFEMDIKVIHDVDDLSHSKVLSEIKSKTM